VGLNEKGEIVYFEKELFGNLIGTFELLDNIVYDIKPKGHYTVPELELKEASFKKVIETIKERFLKGEKVEV